MAVVVTVEIPNATTQQYDQVVEKMDLGGKAAPHGMHHVCADDGAGGLFVCDVWDSAEAFQEFAETKIGPYLAEVGVTERPKITVRPVHNILQA